MTQRRPPYAVGQDADNEEQTVLDAVREATRLWADLCTSCGRR
jgi:hypothetical protein